ncbi:hypothetical protein CGCF413_v007964 [Colletotrichum fructicola]|nr:hypothetical protein CGCF413_v007964 [Colletotrichum fructicola]
MSASPRNSETGDNTAANLQNNVGADLLRSANSGHPHRRRESSIGPERRAPGARRYGNRSATDLSDEHISLTLSHLAFRVDYISSNAIGPYRVTHVVNTTDRTNAVCTRHLKA